MTAVSVPAPRPRSNPLERLLAVRIAVTWELALYALIFAVAFGLRFWDLGARALHHDESIHAQWSWKLLQGDYTHDPVFHGPLYYHAQGLVFMVFGASDYTARVSAAIFGCILVTLPLLLRRWLGPVGTMAAVALIAFSPTIVYYSRFFREDIYMAVFVMLMAATMWRYLGSGHDRWLVAFALAFTGSMATKEATYLVVAVFLVYIDLLLASEFAAATVRNRELEGQRWRRFVLTGAYAPWAWLIAAFWPLAGRIRRTFDLDAELPRSGDVLVVLGTLTLPLLTSLISIPLEKPGLIPGRDTALVAKNRLVCRAGIAHRDALAIGGLFAITTSAAAFVGLQWRPRTWLIAAGLSAFVYLSLFTSLWTNLNGMCTGPWGGLDYWWSQHGEVRGDQPWYYYYILMPSYEFLPLVIAIGGVWWSFVRGNAFSRFLWTWLLGVFLTLSWAGEKMPWLNTHLALPAAILAAWTIQRAWMAWGNHPKARALLPALVSVAVVAMGAMLLIAFLPGGAAFHALRIALLVGAFGVIAWAAKPFGRQATATFVVVAVVGALSLFTVRSMVLASFERGDVPKDMLIYTQSSPDIARLASQIDALAEATGLGYDLPIAVDTTDSFAWPWAWYLRDYHRVAYADFASGPPQGDYRVYLVNRSHGARAADVLGQTGEFGAGINYPHRWWFDETYKSAMNLGHGECTAKQGDCGPFRVATWKHIASRVFNGDWLKTWALFWRDHNPDGNFQRESVRECKSCGSVDAVAFFPVNWDMKTKTLKIVTNEPSKPAVDAAGNSSFGGRGRQAGQFTSPVDIEQDAEGNLYVIDSGARRLQKFDKNGNFLAMAEVRIVPGDVNEPSEPWGLAVGNGAVIVADTFGWRVRGFTTDLEATPLTFGKVPDADPNTPPGPFELYGPRDVAFDKSGNLWVTDGGHDRIVVYTARGDFVRAIGGEGTGAGQFDEPIGISALPGGGFAVADMFNSRVVLLDDDGKQTGAFHVDGWGGKEVMDKPYLRSLNNGDIAVSLPSQGQVRIYDRAGSLKRTVTGGDDPLIRPYGIVETADGKLWIVDGGSGRVRQFSPQ